MCQIKAGTLKNIVQVVSVRIKSPHKRNKVMCVVINDPRVE